jgi:RNA polymerase sigma-70 factor (ECF subfamily)
MEQTTAKARVSPSPKRSGNGRISVKPVVFKLQSPIITASPPLTAPPSHRTSSVAQQAAPPRQSSHPAAKKAAPVPDVSDQDLMRGAQEGDQQAFAVLYERYSASVLSYLYRMLGNIEDVESIAQEVFLRAYRFRATYRYPQRLSTWLFTITRNLAINQARRRRRNPVRNVTELNLDGIDISGDPCRVAAGATADAEKKEEIARVLTAMDDLPADQREVIVLGIFQDLSYAEMEEITGAKAVTLRSRMFHGLKKLAKVLHQDD